MFLTLDSFFNNSLFHTSNRYSGVYRETDKEFLLSLDLPGMNKDDISLEVQSDILYITGKRKLGTNTYDVERQYTLPNDLDFNNITAKYENGVLEISIPKKEESRTKKILIK